MVLSYTIKLMLQERDAEALREGGMRTYKQQLNFGVQVIVMMGSFYAMGHIVAAFVTERLAVVRTLSCPFSPLLFLCCRSC